MRTLHAIRRFFARLFGPSFNERDEESLDLVESRLCEALRAESRDLESYDTCFRSTSGDSETDFVQARALRMEQLAFMRGLAETHATVRAARRP